MTSRPTARLEKWTRHQSGSLEGFCCVQLASGLIVYDIRIMCGKEGSLWCAMPAQRQVDRDGNPRSDANGKPIYSQIVEFRDKATADRFRDMVLSLIRVEHPGDLEE
jgi:DNA-binding cell septation regulator SpoVG